MEIKRENTDTGMLVKLSGRFTFVDHSRFKEMAQSIIESGCKKCVVDLSGVEFIDSAGLGMLLILKDELGKKDIPFILSKPSAQTSKMIKISHFDQIFTIEY